MPAHPIDPDTIAAILTAYGECDTISGAARATGVSWAVASKYIEQHKNSTKRREIKAKVIPTLPASKAEELPFPEPVKYQYDHFTISTPGRWLILSDVHVPYHDPTTIRLAVAEAKRREVKGVLLNGDTLDSHEVSAHDRDRTALRYTEEIERGKQFLAWLREQLPHARIVYKEGNHEERLQRYVSQRAPALEGLEGLDLQSLLHFSDYGVEWVGDKRVVRLGHLCALHGHEYRGGGGVMPARWLYLRTKYVSICGHFHRTSEHGERNVAGKEERAWSVGCACYLFPRYLPQNQWNHGFAFVEISSDNQFSVDNLRVFQGKIA